MVVQGQQPPGTGHGRQEGFFFFFCHTVAGVENDALAHGGGGVGHDANEGIVSAAPLAQVRDGQGRRHGDQDEPVLPLLQHRSDIRHQSCHHVGLDAQKDEIRLFRHGGVVCGLAVQIHRQSLRFGRRAVGQ